MTITVASIIAAVNEHLIAEEGASLSGSASLALREALRWNSMQGRWRCLHKSATANIVLGDGSIARSADCNLIECITLNDGTYNKAPLEQLEGGYEQYKANRENETSGNYGEPKYYVERGALIYIDPKAGAAYTATIDYWSIHPTGDGVVILFPEVFEMVLVNAVIAEYLDSKGRHNKAMYYRGLAQSKLDDLKDSYEDKLNRKIKYRDI